MPDQPRPLLRRHRAPLTFGDVGEGDRADADAQEVHDAHEAWARRMDPGFGLAELIIAKQRHGSTGKIRMKFEAKITRFSDLAEGGAGYGYD